MVSLKKALRFLRTKLRIEVSTPYTLKTFSWLFLSTYKLSQRPDLVSFDTTTSTERNLINPQESM